MTVVLRFTAALLVLGSLPPVVAESAEVAHDSTSATVPILIDHNRMIVELGFVRPDGTIRTARAWVDTGSEFLTLAESLARDLGLDVPVIEDRGRSVPLASPAPPMRLGSMPLRTEGVPMRVAPGAFPWRGIPAEGNFPASLLRSYHAIFDYPGSKLTIAEPGLLRPRGVRVPCRVNPATGLFMIDVSIDGRMVPMGVDNGSAGTWVSDSLTTAWRTRHPERPRAAGAAGSTNFFGFPFEAAGVLTRLPEVGVGPLRAREVAMLGLSQGLFDWYSRKSAGEVLGFIGANVLSGFRLEVDFPNQATYWTAGADEAAGDLDIVGLTLRPEADGGFAVAGVVAREGRPAVEGVEAEDRLTRVGDLACQGATMGAVVGALRGEPGSTRTLVVERAGKEITIVAPVVRLP